MKLLLPLLLLLICCSEEPQGGVLTEHGIYFIDEANGKIPAEVMDNYAVCVVRFFKIPIQALEELTVQFIAGDNCPCWGFRNPERKSLWGCYPCYSNKIQVATDAPDLWYITLKHEMKHWILEQLGGHADPTHIDPIWHIRTDCEPDNIEEYYKEK